MSATPSTMLELGTQAPAFKLKDISSGEHVALGSIDVSKGLLVMFLCNHCPYVLHVLPTLVPFAKEIQKSGISVIAISSSDVNAYPQDAPEKMRNLAEKYGFSFPYLFDEGQDIAKAFKAACTPDFFLFDENLKLVYRGQFDGSRPKNDIPVTGKDLSLAVGHLLEGKPPLETQIPSIGCNIKWRLGNEPEYFKS